MNRAEKPDPFRFGWREVQQIGRNGYRRGVRKYLRTRPDRQGRLLLEPVRLLMGLREERVICWDADTGEEIPDFADAVARLRELEARTRNRNG